MGEETAGTLRLLRDGEIVAKPPPSRMSPHEPGLREALMATEFSDLLHDIPIEMEYRRGWPEEIELADALVAQRKRDIQSGFTNAGIHRDDLLFTTKGIRATEVLSRGQSKRLCLALLMASLELVSRGTGKRIILLIDDLHSELDTSAQQKTYGKLSTMDLQLFISNINSHPPEGLAKDFKMFHVEHGTIKPRIFS